MYSEDDFIALSKFLRMGVRVTVTDPMGTRPSFATSFPTPMKTTVTLDEENLYEMERKLRLLLKIDTPIRKMGPPFAYLGTNFRGVLYFVKGLDEFVLQETQTLFGGPSNRVVRKADALMLLLR